MPSSEAPPTRYQVTVLGLGAMGLPMAARLASRLAAAPAAADR